jgi:hypothetical protein
LAVRRRVGGTRRALVCAYGVVYKVLGKRRLADDAAAEADGNRMRAGARLQLGEQMANVGLHGLLGKEEALADLPVHEAVGDQLENLDLPHRRLLLELPKRPLERNHLRARAVGATARRDLLKASRMILVAVEDLLALCGVHGPSIGVRESPL